MMKHSLLSLAIIAALSTAQADDNAPFQLVKQETVIDTTSSKPNESVKSPSSVGDSAPGFVASEVDSTQSTATTYGPVERGENIYQIIKKLLPDYKGDTKDVVAAFVRLNPKAFIRHDPNLLQAGVTLVVPSERDIRVGEGKSLMSNVSKDSPKTSTVQSLPPPPIPPKAPALHMPLPGVGVLPGTVPMNNTIRVRENSAESVSVAMRFVNRISTPFVNPIVIDASSWEIQKNGSSVFVKPTTAEPVAMYITGDRPGDPTISVVLVPQDIPPQTVALQLDQGRTGGDSEEAAQLMKANSYNERIQAVMKAAALSKTLPGYSEGPLPHSVGRSENLIIVPEKRYSGRFDDVYVYWIENASKTEVELDESMFYEDGVRAIAFYPEIRLMPGRGTRMFVMSDNGRGAK